MNSRSIWIHQRLCGRTGSRSEGERVFNHEPQDFEEFCRRNEAYRIASTKAHTYASMTVPAVVSLGYVNYAISACVGGLFALAG